MKAKFIGEDGSMGLRNGQIYDIRINKILYRFRRMPCIWIGKNYCPYETEEALYSNWEIVDEC